VIRFEGKVEIAGTAIHHLEAGDERAPTVLLLHGLTATHRYWTQNVPSLARRWRVIALDLPGFGLSDKPDVDYTPAYFVDAVCALLDHKGIRRASVIGNSMGGLVAMTLALRDPERLEKLVLVDPAGVNAFPLRALRIGMWLMRAAAGARPPRVPKMAVETLFRMVFPTRPDLAARYVRSYQRAIDSEEYGLHLRSGFRAARGVLARSMLKAARGIAAPTLIIWGRKDWLLPVTAASGLHRAIAGSRLIVYDESGHCPMVDQPERWNRDVEAFLDGS
jgi:pimeloyl-ACP methyl ester carboxylesterase